ncbi:hypothetical protein [Chryseobacterium sp. 'Rf worker isolate 10']|uniref:hypothetical protein n=1 Tax=Chryseobacterium sp. 'Rf worker isolate 10' TaxID=2887348 RepID=UPI003D6FA318
MIFAVWRNGSVAAFFSNWKGFIIHCKYILVTQPILQQPKQRLIIELFKQGSTIEAIATRLNIDPAKIIFILSGNGLLTCEKAHRENDCRIILTLHDAGVPLTEIAWILSLDIKLIIGTIYTPDQLISLYESEQPLSCLKDTSIISIPKKRPQSRELKLLDILLAKRIIREMFMGKKGLEIAKEHNTSPQRIYELLRSVGIHPIEKQKILTLAKCRDIMISRKLLKEGYDIANVAIHLKIRAATLNTYSQVALCRLPFNTETDLIREFMDLWFYINKKVGQRYPTMVSNDEPDNNYDEFLKGEGQRRLRNSTPVREKLASELIKEIASGKKLQHVSSEFKMSLHKIRRVLRLSNTDIRTIRKKASEQKRAIQNNEHDQFRIMVEGGKTLEEIISIVGYSEQKIINLLKQAGISNISIVQNHIKYSQIRGASVSQIAQDLLCSQNTICKIISPKRIKTKIGRKESMQEYEKRGRKPLIHQVTKALLAGWSIETIVKKGIASSATVYRYKKALKL